MVIATLIVSFVFFLLIGVPVAFILGLTPLMAMMVQGNTPLILAAQQIFTGIDSPYEFPENPEIWIDTWRATS